MGNVQLDFNEILKLMKGKTVIKGDLLSYSNTFYSFYSIKEYLTIDRTLKFEVYYCNDSKNISFNYGGKCQSGHCTFKPREIKVLANNKMMFMAKTELIYDEKLCKEISKERWKSVNQIFKLKGNE